MPLTRASITVASRIVLPSYIILNVAFGLVYTFDPLGRLYAVHALAFQRRVMGGSMVPWGLLFLALALMMAIAQVLHHRATFVLALAWCGATWTLWGAMYAVSVVIDPETSVLAPVLPWFVAMGCIASMMSLVSQET